MTRFVGAVPASVGGACAVCGGVHHIDNDVDVALTALEALFADLDTPVGTLADDLAVLRAGRGKMLAVCVGVDVDGTQHVLRAYSGDLGGTLDRPGWVPSIIRREDTADLEEATLVAIKGHDVAIAAAIAAGDEAGRQEQRRRRRARSATLMSAMIDATQVALPGGRRVPLREAFWGHRHGGVGIPSGTADCGLPKLLNAANVAGLTVLGLAEAWWGPELGDRRHLALQAPCEGRCAPILGALLCDQASGPQALGAILARLNSAGGGQ